MTTTLTGRHKPTDEQLAQMVVRHQVAQFYYTEARLLDERQFQAWLALFTDDIRYLVPIRRNQTGTEFTDALGQAGQAHFDDDKTILTRRVTRMGSGLAWTEDPPSIQRHLITNVEITQDDGRELTARSNIQVHRYRLDREVETFTGHRIDTLRPAEDTFAIATRTVYLDHTTVLANNLNLFF